MFLKSFVKRKRPLSKNKQSLLEEVLPQFKLELKNLSTLLNKYNIVNLEIGFGKGEFLTKLAQETKTTLNIGCEPYIEGVISLVEKIKQYNITNITIWPDDALLLLNKATDHSIDNVYILFPDPWPKRKQQKRRLINPQFIKLLANKLKKKGTIFVATDHHDYANSIYSHFGQNNFFTCQDISDNNSEFFKNSSTKYHQKNIEGKETKLFKFKSQT
ncbi:MAG: tRNA (guanosine(46)-N7)-methyltransferase TrmB [Rickettsiales bacterium]|nr:tRNA (guanosine(46)-N7)-methyltransferase TrmB [Rickettsiales bacterium]